jgi:conjugative relaxase-like TrwC/TraI family protein
MFTMAKIRDGGTYLSQHLTANDYYCEQETVAGRWLGQGAERLGLHGGIKAGDKAFERLRRNRHPDGSGKLTPRDAANRVRFFDFQCSAQKSVSILAVTMGDQRLLAAHDRAAATALAELEKFAACQANTAIQRGQRLTGNIVAAAFRHTASRALDPQVHTHFVVANATWDEATHSWRALTEFEMVRAIRYAGKVYQNELACACRALGYEITPSRDTKGEITGFELAGVSAELRERFSKRRAEIEQGIGKFQKKHGRMPSTAEIHAITVATRNMKLAEITTPAVLAAQRAQIKPAELARLETLKAQAMDRASPTHELNSSDRGRESLRRACAHLFERRSVVPGHAILAEALNQNLGRLELARLHSQAQTLGLIGLTDAPLLHGSFATARGLAVEKWSVSFVDETRGKLAPLGRTVALPATLSSEQHTAIQVVWSARDQVVCLRGVAGVGKTTVLKEIHRGLSAAGANVVCCAPTSSAADTLRKDGLTATTLSDLMENVSGHGQLHKAVLVVDEAGLASNRQGAALLQLAQRQQARVLFIGDSRQHTAVEAGDFLRILETHSKLLRVELNAIRRQQVQAYRDAVRCLALGSARTGLERLDALGWVKESQADYLRGAVDDYLQRAQGGKKLDSVLAVTPTWAEHNAFTSALREKLKARGVLGAGETIIVHEPLAWTRAQMGNSRSYQPGLVATFHRAATGFARGAQVGVARVEKKSVVVHTAQGERRLPLRSDAFTVARPQELEIAPGDKLLVRANDRETGLLNGQIVTVAKIKAGILRTTAGHEIDTGRFKAWAHGYAVTSHHAQSKTTEHVVVVAERLDAKSAYVACSRGRQSCTVHTPDKAALLDRLPDGNRTAVLDALEDRAAFPRAQAWARGVRQRGKDLSEAVQRAVGHALQQGGWRDLISRVWRGPVRAAENERLPGRDR